MLMYNLIEYNDNYFITSGSSQKSYRNEVNDAANENDDDNDYKLNNIKTIASRSFEYKTKITKTSLILSRLDPEVVVP